MIRRGMTLAAMVAEWRKGCSNTLAHPGVASIYPGSCEECTEEFIKAILRHVCAPGPEWVEVAKIRKVLADSKSRMVSNPSEALLHASIEAILPPKPVRDPLAEAMSILDEYINGGGSSEIMRDLHKLVREARVQGGGKL